MLVIVNVSNDNKVCCTVIVFLTGSDVAILTDEG